MFRSVFTAVVALTAVVLAQGPASGKRAMPAPQSTTQKTIQADAVVIGKVSEIEKDDVEVLPHVGAADKVKMKVGVVKIETGLIGAKNVTHVKVLFAPAPAQPGGDQPGGGRPFPGRGGFGPISLTDGQEGLFFLAKHPTSAAYYTIQPMAAPVDAKADTYKDDVAKVKAIVATLSDPMKGLKADKAEDRLTAAATLVQKYRRGLTVPAKEEAIPAEETKAILKALADADWTAADMPKPGVVFDYQSQPTSIASMLGLFPGAPGFPQFQPKPGENYNAKYQEVFKEWLTKAGEKYEIKKFVPKD